MRSLLWNLVSRGLCGSAFVQQFIQEYDLIYMLKTAAGVIQGNSNCMKSVLAIATLLKLVYFIQ